MVNVDTPVLRDAAHMVVLTASFTKRRIIAGV